MSGLAQHTINDCANQLHLWHPLLIGTAKFNERVGTVASECQAFAGRRFKDNVDLILRLARSSTPDEMAAAYRDFWNKAAQDCAQEIATLTELAAGLASTIMTAAQSAAEQASAKL